MISSSHHSGSSFSSSYRGCTASVMSMSTSALVGSGLKVILARMRAELSNKMPHPEATTSRIIQRRGIFARELVVSLLTEPPPTSNATSVRASNNYIQKNSPLWHPANHTSKTSSGSPSSSTSTGAIDFPVFLTVTEPRRPKKLHRFFFLSCEPVSLKDADDAAEAGLYVTSQADACSGSNLAALALGAGR